MCDKKILHNGNDVYRYDSYYKPLTDNLLMNSKQFYILLDDFMADLKKNHPNITLIVDEDKLYETIIRTDQRILHYKMYHKNTVINEIKQAAIVCYWLLKYRVIIAMEGNRISSLSSQLLSVFCLRFVIFVVNEFRKRKFSKNSSPLNVPHGLQKDLLYAFENRDFNYDSLTLMIECLAN